MTTHQPVLEELRRLEDDPTSPLLLSKATRKCSDSILDIITHQDLEKLGKHKWLSTSIPKTIGNYKASKNSLFFFNDLCPQPQFYFKLDIF